MSREAASRRMGEGQEEERGRRRWLAAGRRNEEADARSVSSFLIDSARQSYLSDLLGRSTRWFCGGVEGGDSEGKRSFYWTNRVVSVVGVRSVVTVARLCDPGKRVFQIFMHPLPRVYARTRARLCILYTYAREYTCTGRLIAGINTVFSR